MEFYIEVSTMTWPLYEGDIRLKTNNLDGQFVCPEGISPVFLLNPPPTPEANQYIKYKEPKEIDGKFFVGFELVNMTPEEIAAVEALRNPKERPDIPEAPPLISNENHVADSEIVNDAFTVTTF